MVTRFQASQSSKRGKIRRTLLLAFLRIAEPSRAKSWWRNRLGGNITSRCGMFWFGTDMSVHTGARGD